MLTLTIKKKWFDMIISGNKKEEYREISDYYCARLQNHFGVTLIDVGGEKYKLVQPKIKRRDEVKEIIFRNGYSKKSRAFIAKCKLRIGTGKQEWGAEPGKRYFILDIIEAKPFVCNPEKETDCPKTNCYINGGECRHTFYQQED